MKRILSIMLVAVMVLSVIPFAVSAEGGDNAEAIKIVYIPLDDRPVNKERVEYLTLASGFELVMPESDLYSTTLDPNLEGISDQGNPKELFAWLKEVAADADYFVISLDQLFSGGLVGSRAPFGDVDDSVANAIGADGRYTLSETEKEIVDYLIALSGDESNHVVLFDTVMRLASTGNYQNYYGYDYDNFRLFGLIERVQYSGNDLTIENIVANYNKDKNGNTIAVELTAENQSDWNINYGETAIGSMVFTEDTYNTDRGLNAEEFKEYFAARERKLRIADALYPKIVNSVDRLYIGVDDSNPKITIQTNECNYITQKLINSYSQCALFAGADELGLMGIADIATAVHGNINVNLKYFGNGKNAPADDYDKGTLDESVKTHITAVGGNIKNSGTEMDILVLSRTDNGDGYSTDELTALDQAVTNLVNKVSENQKNGIPTCVIDASCRKGKLSQSLLDSENVEIGLLFGYSEWNTVSNALGVGISNAAARYAYLKDNNGGSEESHIGFLKTTTFGWAKEYAYQQQNSNPFPAEGSFQSDFTNFYKDVQTVVENINSSEIYIGANEDGSLTKEDIYDVAVFDLYWTWNRAFECAFDIGIYENGKAPESSFKITNIAKGKSYETSQLYRQGTSEENWAWSDSAPVTYPDENGTSLTDGKTAAILGSYTEEAWAGFHKNCPDYVKNGYSSVTIDLGKTYNVYRADVYVGTSYLQAGVTVPKEIQIWVSKDGENFSFAGKTIPEETTSIGRKKVTVTCEFKFAEARYVQLRFTSGNTYIFLCEAEVLGVEPISDKGIADEGENGSNLLLGDVNRSGAIDMMDYVLLKRNYFGTFKFDDSQIKAGDVNRSGSIDMMDYILLKRAYFGTFTLQ